MSSSARTESPGPVRSFAKFAAGTFTRNLAVKAAALVLAILVWYTIRLDLTAKETFRALLRVDVVDDSLMLIESPPTHVEVEFEGPTSQINVLRRQDNAEVRIVVDRDVLSGQLTARPTFSPDRGNVEHGYGAEVRIVSMSPAEFQLTVAVRDRADVQVNQPQMDLPSSEWSIDLYVLNASKVSLTGPKAVLDATDSVTPPPIDAAEFLPAGDVETFGPVQRPLELPRSLRAQGVRLAPGQDQEFRYTARFVRSRTPRELRVPFVVYFEKTDSPVKLVVNEGGLLERTEDGFTLPITFTGTPTSLDRLEDDILEGRVRAYIRAEEFDAYARGEPAGRGNPTQVHVELPKEYRDRVDWKTIDPRLIDLTTEEP